MIPGVTNIFMSISSGLLTVSIALLYATEPLAVADEQSNPITLAAVISPAVFDAFPGTVPSNPY